MHDVYSKFSWKIWLIIAIIFAIFVIIFAMFPLFSPVTQSEKNLVIVPTPTKRDSSFNPYPTSIPTWNQQKIGDIIVSSPPYIQLNHIPIEGDGDSLQFMLYTPAQNTNNFSFTLQVIENTKTSIQKLQSIYAAFGYKGNIRTKGDVTEYWVSGTQTIGSTTIQQSVVFFEFKENIYTFNMSYWSKSKLPNLENEFQNIVDRIEFQ